MALTYLLSPAIVCTCMHVCVCVCVCVFAHIPQIVSNKWKRFCLPP